MDSNENQSPATSISVEVVYGLKDKQSLLAINISGGSSAIDAVRQSGIVSEYAEIDLDNLKLGIFSKSCDLEQVLKDGDRVEIYRPLLADPKEIRKRRAAEMAEKKRLEEENDPTKRKRGKSKRT